MFESHIVIFGFSGDQNLSFASEMMGSETNNDEILGF